jgi:hypothetical protein
MTLIACFHPRQCRTLLGDILISSKVTDRKVVLPTGATIAPQRLQSILWKPHTFCRKVIEITPEMVILWAGRYDEAYKLARRAKDWFREGRPTADDVQQLVEAHYRDKIPNFWAIIAPAGENWFYTLGEVTKAESSLCGPYAVAGTGAEVFQTLVSATPLPEGGTITPDLMAFSFSGELMSREILTGEPIYSGFGACYEVLCHDVGGFRKIDDALHVFIDIDLSNTEPKFWLWSRLVRQWYDDDRLCIASMSLTEGLGSQGFVVPSVLDDQEYISTSPVINFSTQPHYVCIHEHFQRLQRQTSLCFVSKDSSVNQYITMPDDRFELRQKYIERLLEICKNIEALPHW